jgi:tetratricopeptide (TPR) repeat protein
LSDEEAADSVSLLDATQSALSTLRGRELIFRRERSAFSETNEYVFKHALLRDVTYESVLLRLRRRYHHLIAQWLEAHAGERLAEYLALIASHYERAGESFRAAEYLGRSGIEAMKVSAYRAARDAFERALQLLSPPSGPALPSVGGEPPGAGALGASLLVNLGRTLVRLSDYPAASARLGEGLIRARTTGEREAEVAALIALGEVATRRGSYEEAERHLLDGLAVARAYNDRPGLALAERRLAILAWRRGNYEEATRWGETCRADYAEMGDRIGLAAALLLLGVATQMDQSERKRSYFAESLALARQIGDRRGAAAALNNLGEIARWQGAYDEARAYYEQSLAVWKEAGDRELAAIGLVNLGEVCLSQDQDSSAWDYLRTALKEFSVIQAIPRALGCLVLIARLSARAGRPAQAAELLGLVTHHPACYGEAVRMAQPVLAALRETLPATELEAALERGKTLDLAQVVAGIVGQREQFVL